jgi:iron complex transport system substrate-binding protein
VIETSVEKIKERNPDLVWLGPKNKDLAKELDKANIQNLFFEEPNSLRSMISRIFLIGRLANKREESRSVVSPLEQKLRMIDDTLKDIQFGKGPRSYIELSPEHETVSVGTLPGDILFQLRTANIFEKAVDKQFKAKEEDIIANDPEVIFLAQPLDKESLETLKKRPGWSNISAVKNGRVYNVDANLVLLGVPRTIDEFERLAKLLYPEKFVQPTPTPAPVTTPALTP